MDNTLAQIITEFWRAQQIIIQLQQERDALKAEVARLAGVKPEEPVG